MDMSLLLTRACWPVFSATIDIARQVRAGQNPKPESARARLLIAFRDAEDIVRTNAEAERAWHERIRAMLVYFVDRRMVHLEWAGRHYWIEHRLETAREGLGHSQSEGGNKFFEDCTELQRQYDTAYRMKRDDAPLMAEQLALYYACIRLGFAGEIDAEQLDDYARRLYLSLPSQRDVREDRLFPDSYAHTANQPARYDLRTPLILIVVVFVVLLIGTIAAYQFAWRSATEQIRRAAERFSQTAAVTVPHSSAGQPAPHDAAPRTA